MRPLQIDPGGRCLAAILHEPLGAGAGLAADTALLVCNPFGQEAVRVHRMQRVLCEQLLRVGMPSLRFDYFGAGESFGDDESGDLQGWVTDLLAADRVLRENTGARRVLWLGTRLGGSLALMAGAALASRGVNERPAGLLLWEPQVDGPAYLARLRSDHERALLGSFGPFLRRIRSRRRAQLIGFGVSATMLDQLQSLQVPLPPLGMPVTIVVAAKRAALSASATPANAAEDGASSGETHFADAPLDRWFERAVTQAALVAQPVPRRVVLRHDFDWTAEDALNTALVPAPALQMLKAELEAMR